MNEGVLDMRHWLCFDIVSVTPCCPPSSGEVKECLNELIRDNVPEITL